MTRLLVALERVGFVACARVGTLMLAWLASCHGSECDGVGCTVAETLSVTGIPASGAPWSVSVCAGPDACAMTTIGVYEAQSSGNATFTTDRPVNGSIALTVAVTGAVVTEGRAVHLTVTDMAGGVVTTFDHTVHLEPEVLGDSSCPVQCSGSHATNAL